MRQSPCYRHETDPRCPRPGSALAPEPESEWSLQGLTSATRSTDTRPRTPEPPTWKAYGDRQRGRNRPENSRGLAPMRQSARVTDPGT